MLAAQTSSRQSKQSVSQPQSPVGYVVRLSALDRRAIVVAGGKAANLGELTRSGFPVPPGFCITTPAYAVVAMGAALDPILDAIAETQPDDTLQLERLA